MRILDLVPVLPGVEPQIEAGAGFKKLANFVIGLVAAEGGVDLGDVETIARAVRANRSTRRLKPRPRDHPPGQCARCPMPG